MFSLAVRWGNRSTELSNYHRALIEKLHLGLNANPHLRQTNVSGSFFMSDKTKVPLELKPYNAITILSFCREFINEETCDDYKFQAIKEAVDELEMQLGMHLTDEHWEEINVENSVNQLIGKSPKRRVK